MDKNVSSTLVYVINKLRQAKNTEMNSLGSLQENQILSLFKSAKNCLRTNSYNFLKRKYKNIDIGRKKEKQYVFFSAFFKINKLLQQKCVVFFASGPLLVTSSCAKEQIHKRVLAHQKSFIMYLKELSNKNQSVHSQTVEMAFNRLNCFVDWVLSKSEKNPNNSWSNKKTFLKLI